MPHFLTLYDNYHNLFKKQKVYIMILLNYIGFMVCFMFISLNTFFLTSASFSCKKTEYILFIIQTVFALFSVTYFLSSEVGVNLNFIKHPVNILPTALFISCLTYFITYFFCYKWGMNPDFLVAFGVVFILFCTIYIADHSNYPVMLSRNINNSIINHEKINEANHQLKIKNDKDLFTVSIHFSDEESCDSYVEDIHRMSEMKFLKDKKDISFKTKNITVNGIPYNGNGWPCKPLKNKISYQIYKVANQ